MPRGYKKLLNLLSMSAAQVLPKHVPELAAALADPDVEVRRKAALFLQQVGPAAVKALPDVVRLLDDPDAATRQAAAWAAGAAGRAAREAIPALLERLRDADPHVRLAAISSIEQIGLEPTDRIDALLPAVRDERLEVQRVAVRMLNTLGRHSPQAVPLLQAALTDNDWEIFEQAALTLARMGRAACPAVPVMLRVFASNVWPAERTHPILSAVFRELGAAAVEGINQAIGDPDPDTRSAAVRFLRELGGEDARTAFPAVLHALDDPDPMVRLEAVNTLAALALEPERALPLLIPMLQDKTAQVRDAAAAALGAMGPAARPAVPHLMDMLGKPFVEGSLSAAFALGQIGPAAGDAAPGLLRLLRHGPRNKRRAVIFALGRIGAPPEKMIPELMDALTGGDRQMREAAAEAIAQMGAQAVSHLRAALADTGSRERLAALEALRRVAPSAGDKAADLLAALDGENWADLRRAAGGALQAAGMTDVAALLDALNSPEKKNRIEAIEALAGIGPRAREAGPALFEALLDALGDDRFSVRSAARRALEAIGGWDEADLREALQHPRKSVRRWAAAALRRLDPQSRQTLNLWLTLLDDEDWNLRQAARQALDACGDPAADRLASLARDPDQPLARRAQRILRSRGLTGRRPVPESEAPPTVSTTSALDPELAAMAGDLSACSEEIARARTKALAQAGARAVPVLIPLLENGSDEERRRAARVLARIGPPASAALPWLRAMVESRTPAVRLAAKAALRSLSR
ncbi:MAG: hypothetical protein Kow0059_19050 [Candidatus Sumerlaeia bacterium]